MKTVTFQMSLPSVTALIALLYQASINEMLTEPERAAYDKMYTDFAEAMDEAGVTREDYIEATKAIEAGEAAAMRRMIN